MSTTRRQLEDATRERFVFGAATYCGVEGCDRPGAACDLVPDAGEAADVCLMHLLTRIGLLPTFPARGSLPSRVVAQRTCELCDQPAIHQLVLSFDSWRIETGMGGGGQNEWPVCGDHRDALPQFTRQGHRIRVTLTVSNEGGEA